MPRKTFGYDVGTGPQGREFKTPYDQGCGTIGVDWEDRINYDRASSPSRNA